MPLPAPLQALAQYPQFVAVKLTPDDAKPGKFKKLPINPHTLMAASSTDAATWGTYEQASSLGLPVGFVLTEQDPFFCLDIDGALQHDGQWSPLAHELIGAFPGAAVEVSQSGRGLHIWGTAAAPAHKCKNVGLGIELYHKERFIALGREDATGNAWQDFGLHLASVVSRYFPPVYGDHTGAIKELEWTTGPRDDWRGSSADVDLLRRARKSITTAGVYGGGTFEDLWTANAERLASRYPDTSGEGKQYDASSVDRALAQHLAFWTGCDCERMQRLMLQSSLVREKWDREDYMRRTILSAVRDQQQVCSDKDEAPADLVAATAPTEMGIATYTMPDSSVLPSRGHYYSAHDTAEAFKRCVYLRRMDRAFVPGEVDPMRPAAFKVRFGGNIYFLDEENSKSTRDAWEAWTQCISKPPVEAAGTCFKPSMPHGALVNIQGDNYINVYKPADVACTPGDVSPFLDHLARLLPNERDRDILLAYMAAVVQYPGIKFTWAPVIQGTPGNGKTLISLVLTQAIGHKYTVSPTKKQLEKEFNSWMSDRILVTIEDVTVRRDLLEEFKTIITGKTANIELKGVDAEMREVCCNFIFNGNPKDCVPKTSDDRRYAPFFTAQQVPADLVRDGMTNQYFSVLYTWLTKGGGYGHVTHFLRTYQIPDELNPATLCQRAPDTSSTAEAITAGLGTVEQEVLEAIEEGRPGFAGGWVSSVALGKLIDSNKRSVALSRRREFMEKLGYIYHPNLKDGRCNDRVHPDDAKPRLYVRRDRADLMGIATPVEVARAYTAAQCYNA
jgi:hypothetical protein